MTKEEKQSQFFSIINIIASKYGLELKIDPDMQNIDLVGDIDRRTVVQCAIEIGEMAESYEEII